MTRLLEGEPRAWQSIIIDSWSVWSMLFIIVRYAKKLKRECIKFLNRRFYGINFITANKKEKETEKMLNPL
jgi:hypothetical protein